MPSNTTKKADDAAGRRARKRELDRRAQRAARERTRSHIAYLEGTIEALKEQHSSSGTTKLITQLAQVTKERDELANKIASIRNLLGATPQVSDVTSSKATERPPGDGVLNSIKSPSSLSTSQPNSPLNVDSTVDTTARIEAHPPASIDMLHCDPDELMTEDFLNQVLLDSSALASLAEPSASSLGSQDGDDNCDCVRYGNMSFSIPDGPTRVLAPYTGQSIWTVAKELLGNNHVLCKQTLSLEDEFKEDIPIRVALDGWDSVHMGDLPPLWDTLHRIDALQFQNCNPTERLAILTIMHRILRNRADSALERQQHSELPLWLWARPSQSLPHPAAIDFFVWPGLRERFVFSQHRYCSNLFWKVFAESFRIRWPFEFRDCYNKNVVTGKYCISPEFEKCLWDIDSWSMCGEFFHFFPELSVDIPVYI